MIDILETSSEDAMGDGKKRRGEERTSCTFPHRCRCSVLSSCEEAGDWPDEKEVRLHTPIA